MALMIVADRTQEFADELRALQPDLDLRLWPELGRIEDIRFALAWAPEPGSLAKLPKLELIVSVGAGVDHLFRDPDLPNVPLVRFVDPDLTLRMRDYITLHVLSHHRRMTELRHAQAQSDWIYAPEPLASELRVGFMGLGELGAAALNALKPFGYQLSGWSRTAKTIDGVTTFAGPDQLDSFLAQTDILVALLPLTPQTKGMINATVLGKLARDGKLSGPVLINAGRGGLQVESDIVDALDSGILYAASLDVFETEPLPQNSPLWSHPRVFVTPHNAAESTASAISRYTLKQIKAFENGEPLDNLVDPKRGY